MKNYISIKTWLVLLLYIAIPGSCAAPGPSARLENPTLETSPTSPLPAQTLFPTTSPSPTSPPADITPTSAAAKLAAQPEGCSQAVLSESVLLATWDSRSQETLIVPVDPGNGQPLCNIEPIQAGKQYFTAFSPDGKVLAITISKQEDGGSARLHLLDLSNWQLVETPVVFAGWTGLMKFSPDSQQLAVVAFSTASGSQEKLLSTQLALVDLPTQRLSAETNLDFEPRLLEYLSDGSALVLYGGSQNQEYLTQGDPTAILLTSSNLNVIWKTTLPGVLEGTYQDKTIEGPEGLVNWVPGVAFSPQSQELYIVHADSDRLTRINFAKKTLGTVDIHRSTSWIERLLALTSQVAQAKTLNGTFKTAVLSPDGKRLYIVGVTGNTWVDKRGDLQFEEQMQGLQVVDPASGTEIARLEVDSADLALSPDGSQVYLRGWENTAVWTEVIEADSVKPVESLRGRYLVPARKLNGERVLLSNVSHEHQTSLSLIDETTFAEESHWRVRGYANWLAAP